MELLKGIGASKGIAIAKVFLLKKHEIVINQNKINDSKKEIDFFKSCIDATVKQIEKIKVVAKKNLDPQHLAVLDAHIQLVQDPALIDEVCSLIENEKDNALFATNLVITKYIEMFQSLDDEYMKERAADLKDVSKRLMFNILGIECEDLSSINEEVIIVAEDLTPSETSQLNKEFVKGFATDIGGRTSHSAIMARSLQIPAVLGLKNISSKVKNNDVIAIDGDSGEVYLNPDQKTIDQLNKKWNEFIQKQKYLNEFKNKKSLTKDNKHVEIAANIGSPNDLEGVINANADCIGLFRSEFLYMDSAEWPSEEEQFNAYKTVIQKMNGKKVVIRTLDIGGDKTLKYFTFPHEMNPFLGWRAIRFCLEREDIFRTQLRALIRASEFGSLAIMFPMIATVEEFLNAKKIYQEEYDKLLKVNKNISKKIEIGMMVEIPSAAIRCDIFCKYADFVSIGTNDLMQYSMASDRMNEKISYLYQPLNPSILKLIKMTIDGAHKHNKWAGMCGEMAGDLNAIPLLVGLGLDEFSMSASSVLEAKELISRIDSNEAKKIVDLIIDEADGEKDAIEIINKYKNW